MFYDILRVFGLVTGYPIQLLFFKTKKYYESKSERNHRYKGNALVITNHINPLDYVHNNFLFFPRLIDVVVGEMAFQSKFMRFAMKFWGGIKADRQTKDPGFILKSIRRVKSGRLVQIFPEAHNTPDGSIKPFYPSYIVIALKAKCPIIPIITDGKYNLFKRTHLMIGKRIDVYELLGKEDYTKDDILRINDIVYNKVLELRAELDRRVEEDKKTKKKG